MIVKEIEPESIADEIGLQPGDELVSVNDQPIRDIIDYRFQTSDECLTLEVKRQAETFLIDIEKDYDDDLGITFEEIKYRSCGNNCIFCFVDQNPQQLRSNLYFKDEDFRLSFLHGNYVTLTNISQKDLQRIVNQRLSPLYISIHAIDATVRKQLLGIRGNDRLLEKLTYLTDNDIELHTQIVLCPGFNDGSILDDTIQTLSQFFPQVKTIAIVPVGLTRHREKLVQLTPINPSYSNEIIASIDTAAATYLSRLGTHCVYLADEFYLNAQKDIPPADRYDQFEQYENGVGMLRYFMDDFAEKSPTFPAEIKQQTSVRLVTAKLAAPFIQQTVASRLNQIANLHVDVLTVENRFYGDSVRVTGLLTGQDIHAQLSQLPLADLIVLPSNCINYDGLFLDDWTLPQLQQQLQQNIAVLSIDFSELFTYL